MNTEYQNIVEKYVTAYNAFDVNGMTENMHSDIVFENVSGGEVDLTTRGLTDFKAQAEKAKAIFSKRKQTILNWEFVDELVRIEIQYEGELAIDLPSGLNEGDILELYGFSEFTFKEGKIIGLKDIS